MRVRAYEKRVSGKQSLGIGYSRLIVYKWQSVILYANDSVRLLQWNGKCRFTNFSKTSRCFVLCVSVRRVMISHINSHIINSREKCPCGKTSRSLLYFMTVDKPRIVEDCYLVVLSRNHYTNVSFQISIWRKAYLVLASFPQKTRAWRQYLPASVKWNLTRSMMFRNVRLTRPSSLLL